MFTVISYATHRTKINSFYNTEHRCPWGVHAVCIYKRRKKIWGENKAAEFLGMHMSPVKQSYAWLPRKCDYLTDTQTDIRMDRHTPDKVIPMCRYASQATQKEASLTKNMTKSFIYIGSEMIFHFIRYLWNELCFYIPKPLASGYKTRNKFHKYRMKWTFISDSFYHMLNS